jgi:hypothetical protein
MVVHEEGEPEEAVHESEAQALVDAEERGHEGGGRRSGRTRYYTYGDMQRYPFLEGCGRAAGMAWRLS